MLFSSTYTGLKPGEGTNYNEGLNCLLNNITMNAQYGPELATARLTQAFFQHNEAIEAARNGRHCRGIQEYTAATMSNCETEAFGPRPLLPASTTHTA